MIFGSFFLLHVISLYLFTLSKVALFVADTNCGHLWILIVNCSKLSTVYVNKWSKNWYIGSSAICQCLFFFFYLERFESCSFVRKNTRCVTLLHDTAQFRATSMARKNEFFFLDFLLKIFIYNSCVSLFWHDTSRWKWTTYTTWCVKL